MWWKVSYGGCAVPWAWEDTNGSFTLASTSTTTNCRRRHFDRRLFVAVDKKSPFVARRQVRRPATICCAATVVGRICRVASPRGISHALTFLSPQSRYERKPTFRHIIIVATTTPEIACIMYNGWHVATGASGLPRKSVPCRQNLTNAILTVIILQYL